MLRGAEPARAKYATMTQMLQAAAEEAIAPDGLVFVGLDESETSYSWAEIWSRAQRAAAYLSDRGIAPGDRVALVLPTSIGFIDGFFGILLAGAVPVPLYPPVRLGRLDEYGAATVRMLETVRAALVLIDGRVKRVLGEILERSRCPFADVETIATGERLLVRELDPQSIGLIQFSSGTTVEPKAVALTHQQLLAQCAALHTLMRHCPGNTRVGASWLPLYHDMGLIGCLLSAAYYPGKLVLIAPEHFLTKPALWLRAISRHRAFISPAPNFAYSVCAKRVRDVDLAGVDLSCWRLALNGAEPVLASTLDSFSARFAAHGFDERALLPVYGLSEAALAVTFSPPGRRAKRRSQGRGEIVSVGAPVPGFEVKIADRAGRLMEDSAEGRIFARGPSVMTGYFGNSAETDQVIDSKGWLDTGDLGFIADGEIYVSGRAKDVVIIRGANHMPQAFEETLLDIEGLRAGCAVALGEIFPKEGGEGLLILAERGASARSDQAISADIVARLVERTGTRPARVELLPPGTLPRTSSGKLRRGEALRRYRAGILSPPDRVNFWTMSRAMLRSALAYLRLRLRTSAETSR